MSAPTPVQSFLGGLTLTVPVHFLVLLNGSVFGISGFVHRALRGNLEASMGVTGLILGGAIVSHLERDGPGLALLAHLPPSQILISGFLTGVGSQLANGCTSGHMVAGLARLSLRSFMATATFFTTGVITARAMHGNLSPITPADWSLGPHGLQLLLSQAIPLAASTLLYLIAPSRSESAPLLHNKSNLSASQDEQSSGTTARSSFLRNFALLVTSVQFALALRLSNLSEPIRVISFLLLPPHPAFDPSLACLAVGALPLSMILYRWARGPNVPRLGGKWSIPGDGKVDMRLLGGSALFGIGWGMCGICPGPGLVNFGRALMSGSNVPLTAAWLGAFAAGGLLV